jgi:large subunit ribosomal protein L31
MQEKIHPNFHENATVNCACGESFVTGSIMEAIRVEICSKCHPFFTGKVKMLDIAGRVEKFQKKHANAEIGINTKPQRRVIKPVVLPKDKKAAAKAEAKTEAKPAAEAKAKPAEAKK